MMKTNKLPCVLLIDEKWNWRRIGGRFSLGPETGNWAYAGDGIGFAHTTLDVPNFALPGNLIAVLFNVPERFLQQISPSETLAGEGIIRLSNVRLQWEMRFPQ
jgi:hypothetical protein